MTNRISRRQMLQWTGMGSAGVVLAACMPAAPQAAEGGAEGAAPAEESLTFLIWDQWAGGGADEGMQSMLDGFAEQHPDVTFEREVFSGNEQLRDIVKTALGAGTGPDLMYYDLGGFALNVLVEAGQLLALDEPYAEYGWENEVFEFAQDWVTVEGKKYAFPHEFEFEPVYYNPAIYEELGLSVPTTHAEYVANCEACRDAGYIPIAIGNAGNGELRHTFGFPLNNLVGKEGMDDLALCGASWDQPEVLRAIEIITVDYMQNEFYPPSPNAIPGQDADNLFFAGQAVHRMTGSWWVRTALDAGTEFETDIFLYPSINGSEVLPQAWLGSGYQVPTGSADPRLAFDLIDYLFSADQIQTWVEALNVVPPMPFEVTGMNLPPLMQKALEILREEGRDFGWMPAGFSPPAFYDMMNAGFQQILAGEKTPQEQVADLQAAWDQSIEEGLYVLRCEA